MLCTNQNQIMYADKILETWRQKNIGTIEEVRAFENEMRKQHEERAARKVEYKKPAVQTIVEYPNNPLYHKFTDEVMKACPFCGSEDILLQSQFSVRAQAYYRMVKISLPKSEDYDAAYLQFETDKSLYYDEDRYFVSGGDNIYNMGVQLYLSQANEMHYFSSEDRYILTLKADEEAYDKYVIQDVNVAYFSKNTLEYYYDILSKEQLNVEEWKDGYIKGHVNVDSGKTVLFLSVPYEKGWSVNVNGVKTDTFAVVDGAFTAVELPGNGSYDIEMKFVCPGVKEGLLISAIGVIITVLMILWERKREKSEAIKR